MMKSRLHSLVKRRGAKMLIRALGERDEHGDLVIAVLKRPGGTKVYLKSPIVSRITYREDPDFESGGVIKRESRTIKIETEQLLKGGVNRIESYATLEVFDEQWDIDQTTTVWGNTIVVIGLVRRPLVSMNEQRRASI